MQDSTSAPRRSGAAWPGWERVAQGGRLAPLVESTEGLVGVGERTLGHRGVPWFAAMLAVVLVLPSLDVGFFLDDLHHRAALSQTPVQAPGYRLSPTAAGLFAFVSGRPEEARQMVASGVSPWWTDPEVTIRFYRPLTALSIEFDHRQWPDQPRAMHWHNLAWVFACVLAVGFVYRRWLPPTAAGLAALLFAVDGAHWLTFAWLAQRSHLMAATFGMIALLAHDRWRAQGARSAGVVSLVALVASLLSGEAGVAVLAFLAAYALFLDSHSLGSRARSLVPAVGVVTVWRVGVVLAGYITRYSDSYVDPTQNPVAFISALAERLPVLLLGEWTNLQPEILLVAPALTPAFVVAGVVTLCLLVVGFKPVLRRQRGAAACGLAMLLAVVPVSAAFAHSRNLLFVSIGAMGLLACYLWQLPNTLRTSGRLGRAAHVVFAMGLLVIHGVVAPYVLHARASMADLRTWQLELPADADLSHTRIVVLNGPAAFVPQHFPLVREAAGLSVPRSVHAVGPSMSAVEVERVDDRTLRIVAPDGWYLSPLDRLSRSLRRVLPTGTVVPLDVGTVRVEEVPADGRPRAITLRLDVPLEDPTLLLMAFVGDAYHPWQPPPVGTRVRFAAPALR